MNTWSKQVINLTGKEYLIVKYMKLISTITDFRKGISASELLQEVGKPTLTDNPALYGRPHFPPPQSFLSLYIPLPSDTIYSRTSSQGQEDEKRQPLFLMLNCKHYMLSNWKLVGGTQELTR